MAFIVNNYFRIQVTIFFFKPFEKGGFPNFYFKFGLGRFVKYIASKMAIKNVSLFLILRWKILFDPRWLTMDQKIFTVTGMIKTNSNVTDRKQLNKSYAFDVNMKIVWKNGWKKWNGILNGM